MSIGSTLKSVFGFIAGILIPGTSSATANLVHSIQQELADLYGQAATELAAKLAVDTTGMSGPDKVFAILKALVATAKRDGFEGDEKILGDTLLDLAQTAYRASLPTIENDVLALAKSLATTPLVKKAEGLVVDFLELTDVIPTPTVAAAPATPVIVPATA